VPKGFKSQDSYLSDNGDVYGFNNKPYGWGRDISESIKQRLNPSSQLLETFIEFPPSLNSNPCNKHRLDTLCEPVSWFIKVGKGRFRIKVYIGDTLRSRQIDIKINNKSIVKNKILEKNKLETFEDIFESYKELLEVTADCEVGCENAITILNAIEITQFHDVNESLAQKGNEKETTCGHAFTGGRCDIGPDVLNCLFDDPAMPSAKFCNGDEQSLVSIPSGYVCKDQVGKYKCVNVRLSFKVRKSIQMKLNVKSSVLKNVIEKNAFIEIINIKFIKTNKFNIKMEELCIKILDGLFIGDYKTSMSKTTLGNNNITSILCVGNDMQNIFESEFNYLRMEVEDVDNENILFNFDNVYNFIEEGRKRGGIVEPG
jgi:hypothetical protein